jgi:choline kinase
MLKVIILTAGIGSRISREINGLPKSLLKVNGVPLILRNIGIFSEISEVECHVVVGYEHSKMREVIQESSSATISLNPVFETTNSIFSLYLAFLEMEIDSNDSLLVINGDVFFELSLAEELTKDRDQIIFFGDSSRKMEADYKLVWNKEFFITEFGKSINPSVASGEYVGAAYIPKKLVPTFIRSVSDEIYNLNTKLWWEEALFRRIANIPLKVIDVSPKFWAEIDFVEDFKRISDYLLGIEESNL